MPRRILMLLENDTYPQDTRVFNEATTLVQNGYRVTLICPARKGQPRREIIDGVRVYRYPQPFVGGSAPGVALEYAWGMASLTAMTFVAWLRRGFDVVHVHNPPDVLFLIALPYKLLGKRLVYDNHDLTPELMQVKFKCRGLLLRLATAFERLSCGMADRVISDGEPSRHRLLKRCDLPATKVTVVGNGPCLYRLDGLGAGYSRERRNGQTAIRYLGYVDPQDGLLTLLRSLSHLAHDLGRRDFHCVIVGDGAALSELKQKSRRLGLDHYVSFTGRVPWEEAMRLIGEADICVDPAPVNVYHVTNTAVKVLEYMALSKPMVLNDMAGQRATAGDAALYATPGDEADFARRIAQLMDEPAQAQEMGRSGRRRIQSFLSWEQMSVRLLDLYSKLFAEKRALQPAQRENDR